MPLFNVDRRDLLVGFAGAATHGRATADLASIQSSATQSLDEFSALKDVLPPGITAIARARSPRASSILRGSGRESSMLRRLGSGPAYDSTANFVTYENQTIDRAEGETGTGINHHAPSGSTTPLEGFKVLRCNINGHSTGIDVEDIVLGSVEDSYIQSCSTGMRIGRAGGRGSTMVALRQLWLRDNAVCGLDATGVVNFSIDQVAFEKCELGARFAACTAVSLSNSWWERNNRNAEIINCPSTTWNSGSVDAYSQSAATRPVDRLFYFSNKAKSGVHIFDGAWRVENIARRVFATADTGATIIVRSPDLLTVKWEALNGGRIIFDAVLIAVEPWRPQPNRHATAQSMSIRVPGASPGDFCDAWFDQSTELPNILTAHCLAKDIVLLQMPNIGDSKISDSHLITVIVRKRPIVS